MRGKYHLGKFESMNMTVKQENLQVQFLRFEISSRYHIDISAIIPITILSYIKPISIPIQISELISKLYGYHNDFI